MKKNLYIVFLLLFNYFAINIAFCAEDFFLDTPFENAQNQTRVNTQKTGLFEKIKNKLSSFKKQDEEEKEKGYYGTLPNIEEDFEYKKQMSTQVQRQDMVLPEDELLDEEQLKEAPYDDALFLDKIIKKETSSEYLKDIQKLKFALNNLKQCIEANGDIQRFNANVNVIDLMVQNLKKKYQDKSEATKESYIDILNTNYYAKVLGNLKFDANYYARYIETQQGKYSKENIQKEEQKLLNKVNHTLFLIGNEK